MLLLHLFLFHCISQPLGEVRVIELTQIGFDLLIKAICIQRNVQINNKALLLDRMVEQLRNSAFLRNNVGGEEKPLEMAAISGEERRGEDGIDEFDLRREACCCCA